VRIALTLDSRLPENNDYVRALLDAGARREEIVVLRPGDRIEGRFDGVVIAGGDDVDPRLYGREVLTGGKVKVDTARDSIDFSVFEKAWRDGVPALGVCRGLQVMNVARGGTLYQHLPLESPSEIEHSHPKKPNRRDHAVAIRPGTRLAGIAGTDRRQQPAPPGRRAPGRRLRRCRHGSRRSDRSSRGAGRPVARRRPVASREPA
jgi:gamma-glutamyl-gamma-aminobutyrate hydrolase PuuD